MKIRKALVLAAGEGTRLRPLTYILPKPLNPVCNVPVMQYIILKLKEVGVEEIYINLHHKGEYIERYFGDGSQLKVRLRYLKEDELSGTAGALKKLSWFFEDGPFIVIGGDDLIEFDLQKLVEFHISKNAIATIGLYKVDDPRHYGIVITDEEGKILEFQEKPLPQEAKSDLANTGVYVFSPEIFRYIPEIPYDFGKQVFPKLVKAGEPFYGMQLDGFWVDIGNLKTYMYANFASLERELFLKKDNPYSSTLDQIEPGVYMGRGSLLGYNVKLKAPVLIGNDVIVRPDTVIEGPAVIGDGSVIEGEFSRVVIWPNQKVIGGCVSDAILASDDPFKMMSRK